MYNPTLRLLAILELLQSRGKVSGQELARTIEVEERSIRRYIMQLQDMGIPIEGERGRHGGYSLRPGFRLPPLMFNAEEITAVMLGLMMMHDLGATSTAAVESATAKIERVLPETLRQAADALRQSLILDEVKFGTYAASSEQLMRFSHAAYEAKCLDISYQSASGEITQRRIAPYGIVLHGRTWYIPAYCYLREDVRVFRFDRIRSTMPTDQTFTRPVDFDARAFVLNSLAQRESAYVFEVLLHAPLAVVQEYISPATAVLEDRGYDTLMRCYSDDPHWLARYLAQLEISFTILENDDLREALRELAESIMSGR